MASLKDRLNNETSMLNEMEEEYTGIIGASNFSASDRTREESFPSNDSQY